jgi:uncharacterized protein
VSIPPLIEHAACIAVLSAILLTISRPVIDLRVKNPIGTVLMGIAVFVIWIAPDTLFQGYREHWLFTNSVMGSAKAGVPEAARSDVLVLILRAVRATILVPIIEELFWRGWLMRWIISPDFEKIPLGTWAPKAFWMVAVLFASEHGSFWEVGLAAGILYNWWMLKTRSLGDLILAHAVTNGVLSAYVVVAGRWEYWG